MMKIKLPDYIKVCIDSLEMSGFEAYVVGGCVRDSILGRIPNDWDVCTSALPHEIKEVFKDFKTIDVGIEHGTVAVLIDNSIVEITTFRIDGEYTDNRRPDYVEFTSSLKEDLRRRDFTINAMAYSENSGIIDYFSGMDDIRNLMIRCVGDAASRFNEDALRIMRGIRFASQLGYTIEKNTYEAMKSSRCLIKNISIERIRAELTKLILGEYADIGCGILLDLDLVPVILSGLHVTKNEYEGNKIQNIGRINMLPKDLSIRLCVILKSVIKMYNIGNEYDNGLDMLLLRRLRYDNALISRTHILFENYDLKLSADRVEIKTAINHMGVEAYRKLIEIRRVIDEGEKCSFNKIESVLNDIVDRGEPYELKHLKINGGDLLKLGVPKGKEIGDILDSLMKMVIIHPEYNSKDELTRQCLKMIS